MLSNEIHKSWPIMHFERPIKLKSKNTLKKVFLYQFQCKWVSRIKEVKCYRMKSISPGRSFIFSDLYYFNPKKREKSENDQFQWMWVYRIKHVKCYRMKSISPGRSFIFSNLYYFNQKNMKKWKWPISVKVDFSD